MIGRNHKGAIMTTNDRCTHLVLIRRLAGKEFARHKEIAKGLDAEFYFARPYHSWERGANENTNGLIRQYSGGQSKSAIGRTTPKRRSARYYLFPRSETFGR